MLLDEVVLVLVIFDVLLLFVIESAGSVGGAMGSAVESILVAKVFSRDSRALSRAVERPAGSKRK